MDYAFLSETNLFKGIKKEEIGKVITLLNGREKAYKKDEIIFHSGDKVSEIGLILYGSVNIVVNFFKGTSSIFGHVEKGKIFAEAYSLLPDKELLCDVVAAEDCGILFLNMESITDGGAGVTRYKERFILNMLKIFANKNYNLSTRMMHTAPKSIRDRVISYLSEQAIKNGGNIFNIPFSRQQLADYLGVDRSALSNELSKMRRDGLIDFHKNSFKILQEIGE